MRYLEPTTVDEALGALAEHGESAKVIAGGQSLLIMMRERLVDPEVLIGLNAIAGAAVVGDQRRGGDRRDGASRRRREVGRRSRGRGRW